MQFWAFRNWASLLCLGFAFFFYFNPDSPPHSPMSEQSIYDFTVKDIRKNDVSLSKYKGKVLLIVNVASHCGLTETNYKELNALYEKYKDRGLKSWHFHATSLANKNQEPMSKLKKLYAQNSKQNFLSLTRLQLTGRKHPNFTSF